ncbi:hypothetical protein AtubIFM54640_009114 [Aspergillus tubingensis]|nr:hypothetical protein AtubIFM54640_009114 [Aspergillus tubingensis]
MHFLENQAKSTELSGRPRRTNVEVVVPSRRRRSLMQANLAESGSDNDDPGDTDFRTESSESGEDLAPLTNPRKRLFEGDVEPCSVSSNRVYRALSTTYLVSLYFHAYYPHLLFM